MKSLAFTVLLNLISCNHKNIAEIEFIGLQEFYFVNDVVSLQVHSNLEDTVFYYIGLESHIDDEWRPIILDINKPHSDVATILTLANGESREIYFQANALRSRFNGLRMFRFVISYGLSFENIGNKVYSNPVGLED